MGIPGEYYPASTLLEEVPSTAERAPEAPVGGWSGWYWGPGVLGYGDGGGDGSCTPLRGTVSPPGASLAGPSECRLTANRARFEVIFLKVSQNGQVSSKSAQKACHSPYFQKPVGKSALEIPRIPYFVAFSHKELMGHFEPSLEFIVKMTKCRPNVHGSQHAKCTPDTPTDHASKLAPVVGSSSG